MAVSRRFPTDHHGALLPPPAFFAAAPGLSGTALEEAIDRAVEELLILQQDVWISLATDGELRRRYRAGGESARACDPAAEAAFIFAHGPMTPKLCLPRREGASGTADGETIRRLLEMGVRYIQIDGSAYTPLVHKAGREAIRAAGGDPDARLAEHIAADAAVLGALRPEEGVKLALCLHDRHDAATAPFAQDLDPAAAERLFHGVGANRFLFDCGRAAKGDFAFLSLLPAEADAVLGLFDAHAAQLPDPDALVALIDGAAAVIDTDRLSLSPRHALTVGAGGSPEAAWDRQKEVLDYLLDVATRAWGIDF